jgi:formylglycine-generating enzyme required for sulfatase activity
MQETRGGMVFLVSVQQDDDEVAAIAHVLTTHGWPLQRITLSGGADDAPKAIETADAACVVVVFSSEAAKSARLTWVAERAHRRDALVAVRLDNAVHPAADAKVLDLSHWRDAPDAATRLQLFEAVAARAGPPRAQRRPSTPGRETVWAWLDRHRIWGLGALAGAMLIAAGLALFVLAPQTVLPPPATESAQAAPDPTATGAAAGAAMRVLARPDGADPAALRALIALHKSGPMADQARAQLSALDGLAWRKAEQASDAATALAALGTYRFDFPQGQWIEAARSLETHWRNVLLEAQQHLAAMGYAPGDVVGVGGPATEAAVLRFETEHGLARSGKVHEGLLQALRTAIDPDAAARNAGALVGRLSQAQAPATVATAIASAPTGPLQTLRDCFLCPTMVVLPPGQFSMGDALGRGNGDEGPVRTVTIAYPLAVSRTEITFEEWDACVADNGCAHRPNDMGWGRDDRPVVNISYSDARQYAAWLSRKTGRTYRLLTEAEWEYAARAGGQASFSFGEEAALACRFANGADASSAYAWKNAACADGFPDRTAPVARFAANRFGLHDMHGNVWEWVEDCWAPTHAGAPTDGSARTLACTNQQRLLRGGAFSVDLDKLRAAFRYPFADQRMPFFGLRIARVMSQRDRTSPAPKGGP